MKTVIVKQLTTTTFLNKKNKKLNFFGFTQILALMVTVLTGVSTIVNKIKYKCIKTFKTMHLSVCYACL